MSQLGKHEQMCLELRKMRESVLQGDDELTRGARRLATSNGDRHAGRCTDQPMHEVSRTASRHTTCRLENIESKVEAFDPDPQVPAGRLFPGLIRGVRCFRAAARRYRTMRARTFFGFSAIAPSNPHISIS